VEVSAKVTFVDTTQAVIKASEEGGDKALRGSAAYTTKVVRSSIKRKKPTVDPITKRKVQPGSPPGTPPFTYSGHIKRVLRWTVIKEDKRAMMGPVNQFAQTIWDLHEYGGTRRDRPKKGLKKRTFAMGEWGPIRSNSAGGKVRRIQLKTASQVRRANELVDEINARRESTPLLDRTYPKRPFMGPGLSLATSQPKFKQIWEGAIK
jgi:hypothetical protein